MNWSNTSAGIKTWAILFSFLFLFIVAVLLDLQYLYLMAVTLAVLPLASYSLANLAATRFAVRRDHAPTATEDRPLTITLHVESRGGLPQGALRVRDRLPEELVPLAGGRGPADNDALEDWNGAEGERTYQVVPRLRGVYRLGPATIFTTDPLGLFSFTSFAATETEVVVHPLPLSSDMDNVGGEGRFGRRERDGKTHRGDGMDFHGVREYRIGDSLRRVHWPTTARTGEISVIEFERAFQRDVIVALDRARGPAPSAGRHTPFEYAVKIAATLIDRSLRAGSSVTFVTQGAIVKVGAGVDREATRFRMLDALARAVPDAATSLADDLHAARLAEGSSLMLVTGQGDPAVTGLLTERLRHGSPVRVYFVEPASFGRSGSPAGSPSSPAVAGAPLTLITRADDPWEEGGRRLVQILDQAIAAD